MEAGGGQRRDSQCEVWPQHVRGGLQPLPLRGARRHGHRRETAERPVQVRLRDLHLESGPSSGSLPCPRSYHSMVAASSGTLYVFGGCPAAGRLADLHQLDTKTGLWSQLPSGEMEGRGGTPLALAQDGSSLYVVGGFAGREMADIHRFDIASKTWSREEQVVEDSRDYYFIIFSCPRSCPRVSVWPSVPDWLAGSCSCTEGSWSRVPGATLGPATSAARRSSSGPGSPGR